MEILSLLSELDEAAKANLLAYVDTELSREYQPKHRNKAAKLSPDALLECRMSGERMTAQIREAGKVFRVDMTFPLFDLDNDYTLVVCSCQRDSLSLETQRCAHMYFFQDQVRSALKKLSEQAPEDPLAGLQAILGEERDDDEDRYLKEFRWRWVFDPIRFTLHFEKQGRDRYEADADWHWMQSYTIEEWLGLEPGRKKAQTAEQQLFDLLTEAREKSLTLTDGHRIIALEKGSWSFAIQEGDRKSVV